MLEPDGGPKEGEESIQAPLTLYWEAHPRESPDPLAVSAVGVLRSELASEEVMGSQGRR